MEQFETDEATATSLILKAGVLESYARQLRDAVKERDEACEKCPVTSVSVRTLEYRAKLLREEARTIAKDLSEAL